MRRLRPGLLFLLLAFAVSLSAGGAADPFVLIEAEKPDAHVEAAGPDPRPLDALSWLAEEQKKDGGWDGPSPFDSVVSTSLATLAFMGYGHTHKFGNHKRTVDKALEFLKSRQKPDGTFKTKAADLAILTHAVATMALAEAYAISMDFTLKKPAEKAVRALMELGRPAGWAFESSETPNSFATTWAALALKAARLRFDKLEGLKSALRGAKGALETAVGPDGRAGFQKPGDGDALAHPRDDSPAAVPLFTAGTMLGRIFGGDRPTEAELQEGRALLSDHPPHPDRADAIYWYLATYAQFMVQRSNDEAWKAWMNDLSATLSDLQNEDGSFPAVGLFGAKGGEAATTACCLLSLGIVARWKRMNR